MPRGRGRGCESWTRLSEARRREPSRRRGTRRRARPSRAGPACSPGARCTVPRVGDTLMLARLRGGGGSCSIGRPAGLLSADAKAGPSPRREGRSRRLLPRSRLSQPRHEHASCCLSCAIALRRPSLQDCAHADAAADRPAPHSAAASEPLSWPALELVLARRAMGEPSLAPALLTDLQPRVLAERSAAERAVGLQLQRRRPLLAQVRLLATPTPTRAGLKSCASTSPRSLAECPRPFERTRISGTSERANSRGAHSQRAPARRSRSTMSRPLCRTPPHRPRP